VYQIVIKIRERIKNKERGIRDGQRGTELEGSASGVVEKATSPSIVVRRRQGQRKALTIENA
jgi:hypothetical protein